MQLKIQKKYCQCNIIVFVLFTSTCSVLDHGPGPEPGPGPSPGPEPNLVPFHGPGPGPVVFLVPALVPVPVLVQIFGPVTQWSMAKNGVVLKLAILLF